MGEENRPSCNGVCRKGRGTARAFVRARERRKRAASVLHPPLFDAQDDQLLQHWQAVCPGTGACAAGNDGEGGWFKELGLDKW